MPRPYSLPPSEAPSELASDDDDDDDGDEVDDGPSSVHSTSSS